MSSIRGGAAGAGKQKPVNVNSVFSGRNFAAGSKAPGKHGLQAMGKSVHVPVRRMPPPASLPSLKAENNGQDPSINIVPQAGTGWTKSESAEPQRPPNAGPAPGSDLRPSWAKTTATEQAPTQPPTSSREFPTLAVSAQGKEQKSMNAWETGGPQISGRTLSGSQSVDDDRQQILPSRYYEPRQASSYRSRFQGSNDARASQPGYLSRTDSGRERGDSTCESVGGRSDTSDRRNRQFSESFEPSEQQQHYDEPDVRENVRRFTKVAEEANEDAPKQHNGHPPPPAAAAAAPLPGEIKIMKRPQRALAEISDDEEQKLTKLNAQHLPLTRRVPIGERGDDVQEEIPQPVQQQKAYSHQMEPRPRKADAAVHFQKREERVMKEAPKPDPVVERKIVVVDDVVPAPPPTENIWERRKEERESQEKEKSVSKSYQKTIEHHFPTVADTASIKVDKDLARRPIDQDFTREAKRALRTPVSNDVRQTMRRDDERRHFNRDDYAEREFNQRYNRMTRDYGEDYRPTYRNQRPPARERYEEEQQEVDYRPEQPYHREGYHPRGRVSPKVIIGRGRGRGRTTVAHPARPHPQYQIQRRPQHEEQDEEKVLAKAEEEAVPEVEEEAGKEAPAIDAAPEQMDEQASAKTGPVERQNNGFRGRGRGRGRGDYRRQYTAHAERYTRPPRDDNAEETYERPQKQYIPRGGGYNQSGRRGQGRVYGTRIVRPASSTQRSSEEPSISIEDTRLKSPVVSSEGHEEWETASESSNRMPVKPKEKTPEQRAPKKSMEKPMTAERIRSKNGQPARRTCRSPSDANTSNLEQLQETSKAMSDGLAGLDISNFSKVVAIDDHLLETVTSDGTDDFEEVLNKKAKRQKQLEEQLKQQAEERRKQKEQERLDKIQAKKDARKAAFKEAKQKAREDRAKMSEEQKIDEKRKKEIPITTVWNSAHVAALEQEKMNEEALLSSHIPSPIARPTPKSRASTASDPVKDERPVLEMPASLVTNIDNYDFTFDPEIHEAQARELQEKASVLATVSIAESGSTEDYRLKERLNKVKDLWGTEGDKEAGSLPSNVAKVKPQPQGGDQPIVEIGKEATTSAGGQSVAQRSPSITPFSAAPFGGIAFPNYLGEMGTSAHYGAPVHNSSMLPPPNATSPPSLTPSYLSQQRHGGRNFIETPMYNPVQPRNMWAATGPMDSMMSFSNTPTAVVQQQPPPNSTAQFNFANNRGNMPQMQRGYPAPPPNNMMPGQQHKMNNGPPIMFAPPSMPLDVMSMSMPPPTHHNPSNLGAGLRNDRSFQSLMTNSFSGPPHQPPHQFTQPPPSMDMRFAQAPPPPFGPGHDMTWNPMSQPPQSNKPFGSQQQQHIGGNFRAGGQMNRPPPPQQAIDVWSNTMSTPIQPYGSAQHHGAPQHRMFQSNSGMNKPRHHDRSDMKRPSSAGQQANGTSA